MPAITNIAAYRFARMEGLKELRGDLIDFCKARALKGTILLAPEGINLFVAGDGAAVEELLEKLRSLPGLADLMPKYSESDAQPFSRMLVRLKKEIIAFGVEGIDPATYTSPRLEARTLKQWLDEGKPVILYDTRNDYEVKLGTFRNAITAGIDHFRHFPEAVAKLPAEIRDAPVVTFCTGGIRCEKAAPFMERAGFREVYQLEGGILKYFEEVGGDHYDGECFVFDQRVGVDPALQETGSAVCFTCQAPLTQEEQEDTRYVAHVSCPHCYRSAPDQMVERIAARHAALQAITHPLPGSQPYENRRPLRIPGEHDGKTILDALEAIFAYAPQGEWRGRIDAGHVIDPRGVPASPERIVRAGEEWMRLIPGNVEPEVNAGIRVMHEDEAIVVIDKPAPLPMHPCGRFNRNTLVRFVHEAWHPEKPRPAHRLDANTTGVLVFARTRHFAKLLNPQFARGEVEKLYLARVHGHPAEDQFIVDASISEESVYLGAREIEEEGGLESKTEFRVLRRDADGTALLEVRPLTGRTNQIRIHLWHAGFPIVGDPVYLREGKRGEMQTSAVGDPAVCLHAWRIWFQHPSTGERASFEAQAPEWAALGIENS
ncbi:sulfurtransferase [Haloferula sp. BvORR071]|uniref:sulfurtransferase n=1 Tax=Haloferula sp. BvORR071 TaxID=1396141 RepID=UPI000552CCBF|nr:sulfurtransferase [Haloferula sp. BvORR071]